MQALPKAAFLPFKSKVKCGVKKCFMELAICWDKDNSLYPVSLYLLENEYQTYQDTIVVMMTRLNNQQDKLILPQSVYCYFSVFFDGLQIEGNIRTAENVVGNALWAMQLITPAEY